MTTYCVPETINMLSKYPACTVISIAGLTAEVCDGPVTLQSLISAGDPLVS